MNVRTTTMEEDQEFRKEFEAYNPYNGIFVLYDLKSNKIFESSNLVRDYFLRQSAGFPVEYLGPLFDPALDPYGT